MLWLLLATLIPQLSRRLLDLPNLRSSHSKPIPRWWHCLVTVSTAATTVALLVSSGSAATQSPLLVAPLIGLPLALVGFLDDLYSLPATWRYIFQLVTAVVVVLVSPLGFKFVDLPFLLVLLLIAITAVINFTNFMDGLDGLVAGCLAVSIAVAAIQLSAPWPIWALVGALLGFLYWNWSPAKVFMGDVGSTFLGAVFALLILQAPNWSEVLSLFLVATPVLGDAFICVLRRLFAGQRVFQAHRLHLFQRLHQAGWPMVEFLASTSVQHLHSLSLLSGVA